MPDIIGEYIDRLVTVEMRNRGMNHNIIAPIYEEARREGVEDLSARELLKLW